MSVIPYIKYIEQRHCNEHTTGKQYKPHVLSVITIIYLCIVHYNNNYYINSSISCNITIYTSVVYKICIITYKNINNILIIIVHYIHITHTK